jgi:hypothetical protein
MAELTRLQDAIYNADTATIARDLKLLHKADAVVAALQKDATPIARVERHSGALRDMAIIVWLGEQPPEGTLLYAGATTIEPYYSTLLRHAFDALAPFLSTLPDGTALLNTTPTQQELWKLHAVHARLADAVRRFETAALQAQQPINGDVESSKAAAVPSVDGGPGNYVAPASAPSQQPGAQAVGYVSPHVIEHLRNGGHSCTTITAHRAMLDDVALYTQPPSIPEPSDADAAKALSYYRSGLEHRDPDYVPARVRLANVVTGDGPFRSTCALPGDHDCECNSHGAVSVRATNGKMLGIKPAEFDVIAWRSNDRARLRERIGQAPGGDGDA